MNSPTFSRILPVLRGNYPDPTILRVGPDYYLTHSSLFDVPALLLWHSTRIPIIFCGSCSCIPQKMKHFDSTIPALALELWCE